MISSPGVPWDQRTRSQQSWGGANCGWLQASDQRTVQGRSRQQAQLISAFWGRRRIDIWVKNAGLILAGAYLVYHTLISVRHIFGTVVLLSSSYHGNYCPHCWGSGIWYSPWTKWPLQQVLIRTTSWRAHLLPWRKGKGYEPFCCCFWCSHKYKYLGWCDVFEVLTLSWGDLEKKQEGSCCTGAVLGEY